MYIDKGGNICYINCINTNNTVGGGEMINLDYKSGASLHEQIETEIKKRIISGVLCENEQLPSVRELSLSLTVNPNTVQRAYKQLEQDGFIYSIKGKGNFVASISRDESEYRRSEIMEKLSAAARELAFLGAKKEELITAIENVYKEEKR
ncbi:MAG: GntR family transcriptional regulator [Ruminococcaceae bacterium]|nr:GntR family transcriptional regulator [Oscillospiraceae bacterium]